MLSRTERGGLEARSPTLMLQDDAWIAVGGKVYDITEHIVGESLVWASHTLSLGITHLGRMELRPRP